MNEPVGFTYSRSLIAPEDGGLRPYLILVAGRSCSVVRLGLVPTEGRTRAEASSVASELVREFYQQRLRTLPGELQVRFHQQIDESDEPDALLERVLATADLPRISGVDWVRVSPTQERIRVLLGLIDDDYEPRPGDRVLLAGDSFWDVEAVVEEVDDTWAVCRPVSAPA